MKISRKSIRLAAQKIASSVKPEKIILFGSYAYGKPTPDSDVDFLIIVPQKSRKGRDHAYDKASDVLIPRPFPVDLLIRSQRDIAKRIREGDFFLKEIIQNGKVLYER
jgi:predicted nucleotidyltransferase